MRMITLQHWWEQGRFRCQIIFMFALCMIKLLGTLAEHAAPRVRRQFEDISTGSKGSHKMLFPFVKIAETWHCTDTFYKV